MTAMSSISLSSFRQWLENRGGKNVSIQISKLRRLGKILFPDKDDVFAELARRASEESYWALDFILPMESLGRLYSEMSLASSNPSQLKERTAIRNGLSVLAKYKEFVSNQQGPRVMDDDGNRLYDNFTVYLPEDVVWTDTDSSIEPFERELERCIDCFLGPLGLEPDFLRIFLEYADYGVEFYKLSYWWGKSEKNIENKQFYRDLLKKAISRMTVNSSKGIYKVGDFDAIGVVFTRKILDLVSASRYFGRLQSGEIVELLSSGGKSFNLSDCPCVLKPKILACYFAKNIDRYPILTKLVELYRTTFPRDAECQLLNGYAGTKGTADLWQQIVDEIRPDFSNLIVELEMAASEIELVIDNYCSYEEALDLYDIINYDGRFDLLLDNFNMV